jgi:hypothetical protein
MKRKRFEDAISNGSDFEKSLSKVNWQTTTSFLTMPVYPLLQQTKRTRFLIVNNGVPVMHRQITRNMLDFINNNYAKVPAVYIHGPQGVGKSYSLFENVCKLSADKSNRVIYIPDCGSWALSGEEPLGILLEAIYVAFAEDKSLLQQVERTELNEKVRQIKWCFSYPCRNSQTYLYISYLNIVLVISSNFMRSLINTTVSHSNTVSFSLSRSLNRTYQAQNRGKKPSLLSLPLPTMSIT